MRADARLGLSQSKAAVRDLGFLGQEARAEMPGRSLALHVIGGEATTVVVNRSGRLVSSLYGERNRDVPRVRVAQNICERFAADAMHQFERAAIERHSVGNRDVDGDAALAQRCRAACVDFLSQAAGLVEVVRRQCVDLRA